MLTRMDNSKNVWDQTWSFGEAQSWYPDEQVIRFLARYVSRRSGFAAEEVNFVGDAYPVVLDLGCGKGRHVIAMAELGIDVHGVDLSDVAVDFAGSWLAARGLTGRVRQGSIDAIRYSDSTFDCVICHGVLDHMLADVRDRGISEVERVLKPGGLFFFSVISERDSAYGEGDPVEPETWIIPEGFEKGVPQVFFDRDRVYREFATFEIESIVQTSVESLTGRSMVATDKHYPRIDRYYVLARKPDSD